MSDTLIVNLASADWPEKRAMTAAHPVPLSNVSSPRVFTSIYLKVITSYYAHILLIAMLLYFDRILQDSKLTKQNYVYIRPHFCLLHKIFDVTILAKPSFVFRSLKHHEILSWPPMPRDVWSNAIIWRNQNKKRTYPLRLTRCFACAHFWSASTQSKHGVIARHFQRVRSEINIIEGALMTKRP